MPSIFLTGYIDASQPTPPITLNSVDLPQGTTPARTGLTLFYGDGRRRGMADAMALNSNYRSVDVHLDVRKTPAGRIPLDALYDLDIIDLGYLDLAAKTVLLEHWNRFNETNVTPDVPDAVNSRFITQRIDFLERLIAEVPQFGNIGVILHSGYGSHSSLPVKYATLFQRGLVTSISSLTTYDVCLPGYLRP
jgi:hypothetical protein